MLPSTAGDALLAVQLQDEDQVALQTAYALLHERLGDQPKSHSANIVAPN